MLPGYGRELFSTFVPSSARARLDGRPRSSSERVLLSGALVARHAAALGGPIVEVTWAGRAALTGVLRAARHADLIVAVGVPALVRTSGPHASRVVVDEILGAADQALFDRPLITVARALPLPHGASVERLSEQLYRDVDAGFTALAFSPAAFQGDVAALGKVTAPLAEQDLGLEVELDGTADAALVLARIDDAGLSLTAVRGANPGDELGGALLIVDAARALGSLAPFSVGAPGLRIVLDERVQKSCARIAGGDDERMEAAAFMASAELLELLAAKGTAGRLLDVLAQGMR